MTLQLSQPTFSSARKLALFLEVEFVSAALEPKVRGHLCRSLSSYRVRKRKPQGGVNFCQHRGYRRTHRPVEVIRTLPYNSRKRHQEYIESRSGFEHLALLEHFDRRRTVRSGSNEVLLMLPLFLATGKKVPLKGYRRSTSNRP